MESGASSSTAAYRRIFSAAAFALERDWTYVPIRVIVLAILLYELAAGGI